MWNLDNVLATRRPAKLTRGRDKTLRVSTALTLETISTDPLEYRQLEFNTYKSLDFIVTRANVSTVKDSGRGYFTTTHEIFGDFNKQVSHEPVKRVTEKALMAAHNSVLGNRDLMDTVLYNVQLHYTAKQAKEA